MANINNAMEVIESLEKCSHIYMHDHEPLSLIKIKLTKTFKVKYQTSDGINAVISTQDDDTTTLSQLRNYQFLSLRKTLCDNSSLQLLVLEIFNEMGIINATRSEAAAEELTKLIQNNLIRRGHYSCKYNELGVDLKVVCFKQVKVHATGQLFSLRCCSLELLLVFLVTSVIINLLLLFFYLREVTYKYVFVTRLV